MFRSAVVSALCLTVCLPVATTAAEVSVVREEGRLQVTIGGTDFATYVFSEDFRKPFFLPVRAADGTVLTRALNDPDDHDHPHHKGVWVAVDEVNGISYWNERGRIAVRDVSLVTATGDPAVVEVSSEWMNADESAPVVTETTRISIFASRLMVYDIRFSAQHGPVTFGDTKEGLLGYRMAPSMKERRSGHVVSSDGTEGTAACWGRRFAWIDYSGQIGDKTYGVTLMDHPGNFRPARYHVRNYGLFSISPFGERAYTKGRLPAQPVVLQQDETLRLVYGIYFHDGDADQGGVPDIWKQFVDSTELSYR